jgi:serpin B
MLRFMRLILPFLPAAVAVAADGTVAADMNRFAIVAYHQLVHGETGNAIYSPFNISTALSMVLAGARGETAAQMLKVLGPTATDPASLAALVDQLTTAANTGGNELQTANALWLQQGFHLDPDYVSNLQTHFHAPPTQLDFTGKTEPSRNEINSWTEQHTKNKIRDLLPKGSVDTRTRLVLTSAIYLWGKWEKPFRTENTKPAPFQLAPGRTADAKFMNQKDKFWYAETPSAQVLEMRYAGTGLAFDAVLPKAVDGLAAVEESLTPASLQEWFGGLIRGTVDVSIPKFRAESTFSLRKALTNLGMPDVFHANTADLSGIDGKRDLVVSEVLHKAFVDVSEEGTEAAAATGAVVALAAAMPTKPAVFHADHPFLFFIRDTRSGVILFAGRLTDPKN